MNRLNLDFNLQTSEERSAFVEQYLKTFPEPTETELKTIADYILWGANPNKHQCAVTYDLKEWSPKKTESLEVLTESPTFNESMLKEIGSAVPYKMPTLKFEREIEAKRAGPYLPILEDLWEQIDELDFQVETYELAAGTRDAPIRDELRDRIEPERRIQLQADALTWNSRRFGKNKRSLLAMRRQQYTVRDSYAATVKPAADTGFVSTGTPPSLGTEIEVKPFNLRPNPVPIFTPYREWRPAEIDPKVLKDISDILWRRPKFKETQWTLDLTNGYHITQIVNSWSDLEDAAEDDQFSSAIQFIETFEFYEREAELDEVEAMVLSMKKERKKNDLIQQAVNSTFGHSYTSNYMSTIYQQRVVEKIAAAAKFHRELLENLFYPENWKTCTLCGQTLLACDKYFMHRKKSADGFDTRCKKCRKAERDAKTKEVR